MREFWIIGGFGISLFLFLLSISDLRIYFRTGMKGSLFSGVGGIVLAFSFLVLTILFIFGYFWTIPGILFVLVGGVGFIIGELGFIIIHTSESGLWKEICEKTTSRQILTGNIPIFKFEKPPPPAMSKRAGLILGITAISLGSLLILLNIFLKIPEFANLFFISGTFAFIFGLLLVIFSVVYLDKSKKSPEEKLKI